MDWATLFSHHRLGQTASPMRRVQKPEGRSDFQRDFDRVLFSSAFRRLQSKTQVVPLPENDFVHTRLTHSLEASCVGRSLGRIVGNRVIASQPDLFRDIGVTASDFESVVAAACLAHDIGNPPFGHSGEDAISEYFMSDKAGPFLRDLTPKQIADLQRFEGNAAGFRLLTHTSPAHSALNTGLGLTYATLGAFSKYPKESLPQLKDTPAASEKKFGFFQAEKQTFEQIARELHLLPKANSKAMWHRHPLAFLVEAADDLCYTIIDFEDGFKLDLVEFAVAEPLLIELIEDFHKIEARYQKIFDRREKIGYLRANAINRLIWQTADLFTENLPDLLSGTFDSNLTGLLPAHKTLREIVALSFEKIYRSRPVVEIETAGFEVLAGLLEVFLNAVFQPGSKHSQLVAHLIPDKYLDKNRKPFADKYLSIINITEFIAGMTDTFAIDTYRKVKGISLPG